MHYEEQLGIATLFTELIPEFQVGIVEISVEYFLFIPLVLAMLFDPMSAAHGAATGELVFSEIMLGQFGGLGEVEKFITVTIGVYVAGRLVRNPKNQKMVGFAAIFGVIVQQFLGTMVDILKVQFAIEDFEAVAGLPESVFITEGSEQKVENKENKVAGTETMEEIVEPVSVSADVVVESVENKHVDVRL